MDTTSLHAAVRAWIDGDPDPETRRELSDLLARGDDEGLLARFEAPLGFGTAGLRGPLGAGPGRMNRAVVARATAGLCAHLAANVPDARRRGICIGFDARHGSAAMAREASEVARGAGFSVHIFGSPVPTPLLAFATLELGAAAGAMVTASHNPAADNGFKVYWQDAVQLVPPHDAAIAAAIAAAPPAIELPRQTDGEREHPIPPELGERYVDVIAGHGAAASAPVRIAYTALHGVGERWARAVLSRGGFEDVHSVASQAEPDPDFPTVAFPNPEEAGAMDRLLALAEEIRADLALANDPDADRLAAAVRAGDGSLMRLTGNDLGALLCDAALESTRADRPLVVASIVSGPLVQRIAHARGARFEAVLTGFKWVEHRALELSQDGYELVLGFEEALGYAVSERVRDKDGLSAALALARLTARERARGSTPVERLRELWRRHGVCVSTQRSLRLPEQGGAALGAERMAAVRAAPPATLAGLEVTAIADLSRGVRREGTREESVALPKSNVLIWELAGGSRVIVRPSGTEPKIKLYVDVREPLADREPLEAAHARATERLAELARAGEALLLAAD